MTTENTQDPAQAQEAQTPDPNPVEKRIATLTRQRREAERQRDDAVGQLSQLSTSVQRLEGIVQELASRPAGSPPASQDSLETLISGGRKQQTPSAPGVDLSSAIKAAVNEALAPVVQEADAAKKQQALFAEQKQYFDEAAKFVPDVAKQGTPAQELFDVLWQANPELHSVPRAPALLINAVSGILGGARQPTAEAQEAKKVAASGPTPLSPIQRIADTTPGKPSEQAVMQSIIDEGAKRELTEDDLAAFIGLASGRVKVSEGK